MKTNRLQVLFPAVLLVTALLAGCTTTEPPAPLRGRADLLDFLTDTKTAKEEVLVKLGEPTGKFEQEKILTYKLGFDARNKGYILADRSGSGGGASSPPAQPSWLNWYAIRFNLVLVFDDQGILRRHSLVEVNK